jgi:hypothetical protein
MSLIITYIGSKGCVIAGDKRRIGFFGPENNREKLEKELYFGKIHTQDELLKKAGNLGITLKISDDADKIREIGDVVVGEVRSKTTIETKRKRIYATTAAYNMVELVGSEIKTIKSGGSSIVVFGNKYTQELAEKTIKKNWKSKITLIEIGKIFESVMEEVSIKTPSVSPAHDVMIKYPSIKAKEAKELLRTTILQDVKELENWRNQLQENLIKTSQNIQMATKIIIQGNIGRVSHVDGNEVRIVLDPGVEALDTEWKSLAKPSETIIMTVTNGSNVSKDDLAVIEDENLCIQRTKESLNCDYILCKAD